MICDLNAIQSSRLINLRPKEGLQNLREPFAKRFCKNTHPPPPKEKYLSDKNGDIQPKYAGFEPKLQIGGFPLTHLGGQILPFEFYKPSSMNSYMTD